MKAGFAAALSDQMKVKGWDIAKLAREIETSYEYARRLTTGQSFPSRFGLKAICGLLELDQQKMRSLVVNDKITLKYGAESDNPRFAELQRLLPDITDEQYQIVLGMVEGWAQRNRQNRVDSKLNIVVGNMDISLGNTDIVVNPNIGSNLDAPPAPTRQATLKGKFYPVKKGHKDKVKQAKEVGR